MINRPPRADQHGDGTRASLKVVALIALIGTTLSGAASAAAVDLSGTYTVFDLSFEKYCVLTLTQTGTDLSMTGACDIIGDVAATGTVEPDSGTFAMTGAASIACTAPGSLALSGTGTGTTLNGILSCPPYAGHYFIGSTTCANGVIDEGEQCDDHNLENFDCCSSDCQFEPSGSFCADADSDPCTADGVCDGSGSCVDLPAAAGTPCGSDNNPCTNDVCNGALACVHPNNTLPCSDDDNPCTTDQCAGGTCNHIPAVTGAACWTDFNPCTDDVCDGGGMCLHPPNTAPCEDGNSCTTGDTCSGGSCVSGTPLPPGAPCFDGDLCTSGDTCDASAICVPGTAVACDACSDACLPDYGCVALAIPDCSGAPIEPSANLAIHSRVPETKDTVAWSWGKGQATTVADFGDPVTSTKYRVCAYALKGAYTYGLYNVQPVYQTVAIADLPAGSAWTPVPKGFKYKSAGSTAVLKSGDAGKARVTVKGRGASLAVPSSLSDYAVDVDVPYYGPFHGPTIVQLRGDGGQCWGAQFDAFDKHTSQLIKMKKGY